MREQMHCYVLIGGASRRMGRSKERLLLDGRTFFDRVVAAAAPVFENVVAVTRPGGPEYGSIPLIRDTAHDGTAAMFGLLRALEHSPSARMWLLGTDFPLITTPLLRYLRDRFEASEDAALAVPVWDGREQMLCAGYSRSLRSEVEVAVREGRPRLRDLLERFPVLRIEEAEIRRHVPGDPLRNVNRPEEYEALRREHEQR